MITSPLRYIAFFTIVFGLLFQTVASQAKTVHLRLDDAYLVQKNKSIEYLLNNCLSQPVYPGTIIASPSRQQPDYFYHWVRDAAITFSEMLTLYKETSNSQTKSALKKFIIDHIKLNQKFQKMPGLEKGLGEPKFRADGTAFQDSWGRPQNDGPALRAIYFISLYEIIENEGWSEGPGILQSLYESMLPANSLIKMDLEYVAYHWRESNFDLWEEVNGTHFFTLMVQRKALLKGAELAQKKNDSGAAAFYRQEAAKITPEIEKFWNSSQGFIGATRNHKAGIFKKSNLDTAVLLGAILGDAGDGFMSPTSDRVLASLQKLKEAFRNIYAINQNTAMAEALGRYPEDTYDGYSTNSVGNPWFITTQTAAEIYYRTYTSLKKKGVVKINSVNKKFYQALLGKRIKLVENSEIRSQNKLFAVILNQLLTEGDRHLNRTLYHGNKNGSLSEQMNRNSGYMQGAADLTWSYASYLSTYGQRERAQQR